MSSATKPVPHVVKTPVVVHLCHVTDTSFVWHKSCGMCMPHRPLVEGGAPALGKSPMAVLSVNRGRRLNP